MAIEETREEQADNTRDWLPEEYREDQTFSNYKDIGSLLKTFKNQESMIGNRIKPPSDDMSDEEYQAFVNKVRPSDVTEYGLEADEKLLSALHESGVPKRMAKDLVNKLVMLDSSTKEARAESEKQQRDAAFKKLVDKYGSEEAAQETVESVKNLIDNTVGKEFPEFTEFLQNATVKVGEEEVILANHPIMAEALKVMVDMTTDDDRKIEGDPATAESLEEEWVKVLDEMSKSDGYDGDPTYDALKKRKREIEAKLAQFSD